MYSLPYFKETDKKAVLEFMHQHPFAFMAGCDVNNQPVATQIPVFIEEKGGKLFLTGHLMKNTDHHKAFETNNHVLCVFTGAHAYVSASWYSNPHQASTWNYMSVHVKGTLSFLDEQGLINVLQKTSLHFEQGRAESPTVYNNLSKDYVDRLIKAIVAFEVEVLSIENVFKLSQNRDKESFHNIIKNLKEQDDEAKQVAREMEKRESHLFKEER